MSTAGTVTVDFAAETAKFTAELKKVRGDLRSLKDDTSSLAKGFAAAGKVLVGVFSAAAIGGAFRAVIQATEESQAAVAQLEGALRSAGAQVAPASARFQEFASELQRVSTFGDEAIVGVETLLLSFRSLSGQTVLDATRAVLDLSTRLGTDLRSSALLVGKALEDPIKGLTALQRSGVIFSEAQKRVIKDLTETGDRAAAQNLILAELEKRFGGAAEAARNTLGGALTGLKNAFGDLLEAKDGLPGATGAINQLTETLSSPSVQQGFAAFISLLGETLSLAARLGSTLAPIATTINAIFTGGADAVLKLDKQIQFLQDHLKTGVVTIGPNPFSEDEFLGFMTPKEIEKRIAELKREQEKLLGVGLGGLEAPKPPKALTAPDVPGSEELTATLEQQKALQAAVKEFQKQTNAEIAADTSEQRERDLLEATTFGQRRLDSVREGFETELELHRAYGEQLREQEAEKNELLIKGIEAAEQIKRQSMQATVDAGLGLLQVYAQKSKTGAKALILVNRGLQIVQAYQNTASAVTNALANVPYPYNLAAAAQVATMGAVQIGIIAATGALEFGQVNAGRSSSVVGPGTPNNPIFTQQGSDDFDQQTGASTRDAVQLHIHGNVFSSEQTAEWFIEKVQEAVNDRDVVIVSSDSRNGMELAARP